MAENSRGRMFRKRYVLGGALVLGIALGIYLGKFLGFGLGGNGSFGIGTDSNDTQVSIETDHTNVDSNDSKIRFANRETEDTSSTSVPNVVRVLIDDHDFLLRTGNSDSSNVKISLDELLRLVQKAPGDQDGIRVRVYRNSTSRASTEEELKKELSASGINDGAVLWLPDPVK